MYSPSKLAFTFSLFRRFPRFFLRRKLHKQIWNVYLPPPPPSLSAKYDVICGRQAGALSWPARLVAYYLSVLRQLASRTKRIRFRHSLPISSGRETKGNRLIFISFRLKLLLHAFLYKYVLTCTFFVDCSLKKIAM
jgi:hypothetical protein